MNSSEAFAKLCFECLAGPLTLRPVTDQSRGQHDFDIIDGESHVGILEVTSATDSQQVEMHSAVYGKQRGDRVPAVECESCWHVTLTRGARVSTVRSKLDAYLRRIELAGLHDFGRASPHPDALLIRRDLGLSSGRIVETRSGGHHWIGLPVQSGWLDVSAVSDAVLKLALRQDNVRKVSAATQAQRHFFVYVDSSSMDVWSALDSNLTPGLAPLVVGATELWVAARAFVGSHAVVWRAKPGEAWVRHTVELE